MTTRFLQVLFFSFLMHFNANAALISIDFETDTDGAKANGFISAGITDVLFSDTVNADLYVYGFGTQGAGLRSLSVNTDQDGSLLQIDLLTASNFISLDFGNDDPNRTNAGDLAVLTAYFNDVQVLQTSLLLNRDDIMNQTIALGSLTDNVLFDKILFGYTDQYLSPFTGGDAVPVGAIEIVDNVLINFVPLPGAIIFMLSGVLALGVSCKVKRKSSC